ncbi:HAD family hydrolase [Rhodococcoides corynebacterioides]|uniref:HAD family hydrolase n=1 Tax=Rhodococcoides corynebacterioides TaxID=53972 RepID=UPI001C9A692E|nr:Cof-type HAD-IIB family hydrolase [Rhodococcus corynebacterioides]MBY6351935.1 Cof-type HAD-IIB family hydrolase [Rhodococcus corynebacterioides]
MAGVKLFATDLDGTLLRSDRTVSPRIAAALRAAAESGIEVVWATARARHSVHEFAAMCGFRGIALCANGAVVIDLADGTPVIRSTVGLDPAAGVAAVDAVRRAMPGTVFAAVGPTTFVAEPGYAALCVFSDHHREPESMVRADERFPALTEDVVKIVARHPEMESVDLYRAAADARLDLAVTHSGAPYVEMAARGVSKAAALAALCGERGIDAVDVAAAGDARNDLEMLAWAGTAVVPENAIAEVRAIADRIVPSNDDDGVAVYLEELTRTDRT